MIRRSTLRRVLLGLGFSCSRGICAALVVACTEAAAPDSAPPHVPQKQAHVTLAFGGDVMLARGVGETLEARGPRWIWGDVAPLLTNADLALVNLECAIAASGAPFQPPRTFYFRAHPNALAALVAAGIDYVSLANNHALDYGPAALVETIRRLDAAGIAHAGAGQGRAAAARPVFLEAKGLRIGVVSFADHYREYAAGERTAGTNVIAIDPEGVAKAKRALDAARAGGADITVFSIHWGPNMRARPTEEFVTFARAVIDAGADIFHGHSAHVFQGVAVHRHKPILFDAGDLIDDYEVDIRLRNDRQLLFLVRVGKGTIGDVELVPLLIDDTRVTLARDVDYRWIERRMRKASAELGTKLVGRRERLAVAPEAWSR